MLLTPPMHPLALWCRPILHTWGRNGHLPLPGYLAFLELSWLPPILPLEVLTAPTPALPSRAHSCAPGGGPRRPTTWRSRRSSE